MTDIHNKKTLRQPHTFPITINQILVSLALGAVVAASTVQAQETVGDGTTVRYPAAYFAEYSPVTAQDKYK